MDFAFLFADWLGKPVWMWLGFIAVVLALLVFDLGVLHRDHREIEVRESRHRLIGTSEAGSASGRRLALICNRQPMAAYSSPGTP